MRTVHNVWSEQQLIVLMNSNSKNHTHVASFTYCKVGGKQGMGFGSRTNFHRSPTPTSYVGRANPLARSVRSRQPPQTITSQLTQLRGIQTSCKHSNYSHMQCETIRYERKYATTTTTTLRVRWIYGANGLVLFENEWERVECAARRISIEINHWQTQQFQRPSGMWQWYLRETYNAQMESVNKDGKRNDHNNENHM